MKTTLLAAVLSMAAAAAQAATLSAIDLTDTTKFLGSSKLFTTEIKRDKNVQNNGQRGHDAFLRNAEEFATPASINFDWGASGTTYDWALAYDGDAARLTFGGQTRTLDIDPDGRWNAIQLFLNASDTTRFSTSTTSVRVTQVNGAAISGPFLQSATNGIFDGVFALKNLGQIQSISGTLSFAFQTLPGASGTPNSRLAFNLKALEVEPSPIPVPAAFPLLAAGLGALALAARRRRV